MPGKKILSNHTLHVYYVRAVIISIFEEAAVVVVEVVVAVVVVAVVDAEVEEVESRVFECRWMRRSTRIL